LDELIVAGAQVVGVHAAGRTKKLTFPYVIAAGSIGPTVAVLAVT